MTPKKVIISSFVFALLATSVSAQAALVTAAEQFQNAEPRSTHSMHRHPDNQIPYSETFDSMFSKNS